MTDDTRALALELCDAIDAYLDPDNQYTESRLRTVTRLKKLTRDAALAAARREPPAGLDVQRLARAIDEGGLVTWDDDPRVLRRKTPTEIATDALARTTEEP